MSTWNAAVAAVARAYLCCLVMEERFVVVLFLNAVMAHQSLKVKLENGQAELVVG